MLNNFLKVCLQMQFVQGWNLRGILLKYLYFKNLFKFKNKFNYNYSCYNMIANEKLFLSKGRQNV